MPEEFGRRMTDDRLIRLEQSHQTLELKITELVTEFKNFRGNQEQLLMMHQRRIDLHEELLTGRDGKNGHNSRLNRLEEREGVRTWHLRAIWVAVVGTVAKVLVEGFQK